MITYIFCCVAFMLGYFTACLMAVSKGNQCNIDKECHSFHNE